MIVRSGRFLVWEAMTVNAIRVLKHIDSDLVHIPELREMMGQDVEITIRSQPVDAENLLNPFENARVFEPRGIDRCRLCQPPLFAWHYCPTFYGILPHDVEILAIYPMFLE